MKILFVSHKMPYPPDKGEKIRAYNELKYLCRFFEVHLCSFVEDQKDLKGAKELKKICKSVDAISLSKSVKRLKALLAILSKKPISIEVFYSKTLQRVIKRKIRHENFDVAFCFSSSSAKYDFLNTKIITDFVDVDSQKWFQYSKKTKGFMSWLYKREEIKVFEYEKKVFKKSDISLFVSEKEKESFVKKIKTDKNIYVVPNGVDFNHFKPQKKHKNNEKDNFNLLFTGNMDYFANEDGVLWFVKKVMPLLRKKCPKIKLYVVGSNPSKRLRTLKLEDVVITGYVDDIKEFYDLSAVFVAPLRIAQGVQNKILEAMSMEKPVVATLKAYEGLEAIPYKEILLAQNEVQFAEIITYLLFNPDKRKRIGENARRYVLKKHNWDKNMAILKYLIEKKRV